SCVPGPTRHGRTISADPLPFASVMTVPIGLFFATRVKVLLPHSPDRLTRIVPPWFVPVVGVIRTVGVQAAWLVSAVPGSAHTDVTKHPAADLTPPIRRSPHLPPTRTGEL